MYSEYTNVQGAALCDLSERLLVFYPERLDGKSASRFTSFQLWLVSSGTMSLQLIWAMTRPSMGDFSFSFAGRGERKKTFEFLLEESARSLSSPGSGTIQH